MTTTENSIFAFWLLESAWSCWQQQCTGFRHLVFEISCRVQWGYITTGNQSRQMWRTQLSPPVSGFSLTSPVPWLPSRPCSTGLCTVINVCESCTLNLLQNVWTIPFSQKVTEAYLLVYEQCKLSAHEWDPRLCNLMLFQWPQTGLHHTTTVG